MVEIFEYCSLFRQQWITKINIWWCYAWKTIVPKLICLFFYEGAKTDKTFILKLIIQKLLWLYNRDIYFNLTKNKASLMESTNKITFNIDGLKIHSTLNIHVQQSLSSLPSLSSNSLNRFTCQYEWLQLVKDEISLVGAKIFNVIDNRLKFIKHIQNKFFGGVDVILIGDFYQASHVKDSWIFQISKIMLMH
jgi:hypothetical protein